MGSARSWDFAQQADAPELPPPGRTPGEARTFLHLKERLADRYGIELTWDNFDEVNRAANDGPFILDYEARYEDTDLRVFRYLDQNILAFYNKRNHHLNSVLPFSDLRWRGVPMELRPREALAKTMRLEDQNWLPAHARALPTPTAKPAEPVIPGPSTTGRLTPSEPARATVVILEPAKDFRDFARKPPVPLAPSAPMQQPAAAHQNTEPPMPEPAPVPPAVEPKTPAERLEQMEKLLSWAYFRSLKKGDAELSEAIRVVLMEGA